jgi:KDO2-lipid IV(A) lauroyltransferase
MFESMISSFISEKDILQRYKYRNPEVCNEIFDKGKSILLLMSHYANWEWSNSMPLVLKHKVIAVYKPLHNPWYDDFIKKSRERFGLMTVPMDKTLRTMTSLQKDGIYSLSMFLSDQRPRFAQIQYWTKFLNQDTPVILGPEKIAKKLDEAVVFYNIIPVRRGYYEIDFDLLFENPIESETFEITNAYFSRLEKMIRENPQYWLWTHNRWKHDKVLYNTLKTEKSMIP